MIILSKSKSRPILYKITFLFEMIRFREFSVSTILTKLTIITENVRSLFEIYLSFRKQTRPDTTSFTYDKKNEFHFESSRGHPILFLSKRDSSSYRIESPSVISKRQAQSFRNDSFISHKSIINLVVLSK